MRPRPLPPLFPSPPPPARPWVCRKPSPWRWAATPACLPPAPGRAGPARGPLGGCPVVPVGGAGGGGAPAVAAAPSAAAFPEPTPAGPPLDLQQALALALDGNPGLRAARRALEASDGAVLQSRARPNPELAWSQEDTRRSTRTLTVQDRKSVV